MKVPSFKTKKIRDDILKLVNFAPIRAMYAIALQSVDAAMDELVEIRSQLITDDEDVLRGLEAWDKDFEHFGEREAYYYQEFLEGGDRSVVDAPLFDGDYSSFNFDPRPQWPDIETPWRLANEISTLAVVAGKDQAFLRDLELRFKEIISDFWIKANSLIVKERLSHEGQASDENSEGGKIFGFWPVVAIGAVALVGALGAAAGYSASQSNLPDEYVQMTPFEKHLKTAKTVGIGILIGVALAVVLMLRVRR